MKRIIGYLFFIFYSVQLHAQEGAVNSQFSYLGGQTEATIKQGNIRNDLSTGRVAISYNLLSKKFNNQEISIGVDYLGGGIRVLDEPSIIGHGWNLTGGGVIVRNRRGVPDDFKNKDETHNLAQKLNGILYSTPINQTADGEFRVSSDDQVYSYNNGWADSQHDIFSFSILGKSGKFYIGKDKSIQVVGQNDIQIIPKFGNLTDIYSTIIAFDVIDNKGIRYSFEEFELSRELKTIRLDWADACYQGRDYISAWYLTKIEFPDSHSKVVLSYNSKGYNDISTKLYLESFVDVSDRVGWGRPSKGSVFNNNVTKKVFLKDITFSDSSRIALSYHGYPKDNPMLKDVALKDADGSNVLRYEFNYLWWDRIDSKIYYSVFEDESPYQITQNDDWYLEGITTISIDNIRKPFRSFSYFLGPEANSDKILEKGNVDYWGFYNNADNSKNLIPYEFKLTGTSGSWSTYPAANRNSDLIKTQIGALKEIYAETGSRETIEYEFNDRNTNGTNEIIGGLRVKQVSIFGDDNKLIKSKQYKYIKPDGKSSGFLGDKGEYKFIENIYHDNGGWPTNPSIKKTRTTLMSQSVNDASSINGSHIGYTRVEEYTFTEGTVYQGKKVYEFSGLDSVKNSLWFPQDYYPYRPVDRPYWAIGLPISESIYDNNNALVRKLSRQYMIKQRTYVNENFRSLHAANHGEVDVQNGGGILRFIYKLKNYYPVLGYSELTKIDEITYTSGGALNRREEYTYDPSIGVVKTHLVSSGGQDIYSRFYYPFEYSSSVSSALAQMNTKNMKSTPVLKEEWRGTSKGMYYLAAANLVTYRMEGNFPRKDKEYTAEMSTPVPMSASHLFDSNVLIPSGYNFKVDKSIIKYANDGTILQVDNASGNKQSFVRNRYGIPIFIVDNAAFNTVRYYGFETFEKQFTEGTTTGQIMADPTSLGQKSFSGTIKFTTLPQGNYIVEYFAKGNGNATVNGVNTPMNADWKNFRLKLSNINTVTLTTTSGNLIDEIRIYPVGALPVVSTSDIIGNKVSQIQANGIGVFSSYDNFKRLKHISDDSGNILERYNYNDRPVYLSVAKSYQHTNRGCPSGYVPSGPVTYTIPAGTYSSLISQAIADEKATLAAMYNGAKYANSYPNCVKGYWNVAKIQNFTKNNCPSGSVPETIAYQVLEGKYLSTISQADADNQAMADINQNGQNYANANGKCFEYLQVLFSNDTSTPFEVEYSGPTGTTVTDLSQMETWITVIKEKDYNFYIRPKNTTNPGQEFEFTNNSGQSQFGTSAIFSEKANYGMGFTIRQKF